MDKQISVPAHDGKTIYGLFNQAGDQPSKKLVILAHGLTGRTREFIHVMATRAFTAAGYDVARISFYDGWPGARKLRDCTVTIHAQDLNTFTDHFRGRYDQIFIAGHSYGGLSLLMANPAVQAVSFWDASWHVNWHETVPFIAEIDCFTFKYGQENLIGRAMHNEAVAFSQNPPVSAAQEFKTPSLVALAAGQENRAAREPLYHTLQCEKELIIIDDADHEFTNGHSVEDLIKTTKSWFDRYAT